jgi:hypothetical protein
MSFIRKRQSNTEKCYSIDGDLVYCKYICVLMEELQLQPASEQWRFYINSSKFSLKTILLHNGNKNPSIPLVHAVHIKETHVDIQGLLKKYMFGRPPVECTC